MTDISYHGSAVQRSDGLGGVNPKLHSLGRVCVWRPDHPEAKPANNPAFNNSSQTSRRRVSGSFGGTFSTW